MSGIVLLSDIHIGDDSRTCWYQSSVHQKYLTKVLDWVIANAARVSELVLLGDVVDVWTYPFDRRPPEFADIVQKNQMIFGRAGSFAKVLDALEGRVTYVRGNHDMSVTRADAASIISESGKFHLSFSDRTIVRELDRDSMALGHGHEFTLFCAPDERTKWAPLPVGHFVTRMVAEYWSHHLEPGQTVADLPDQGAPLGLSAATLVAVVAALERALEEQQFDLVAVLIDTLSTELEISESAPILLADGSTTTLTEVKHVYRDLFVNWMDEVGLVTASKMVFSEFTDWAMTWFGYREAFLRNTGGTALGHTHTPIRGVDQVLPIVGYFNTGFMCPSVPDMASKPMSFGLVMAREGWPIDWPFKKIDPRTLEITDFKPPLSPLVNAAAGMMDFSCYGILANQHDSDPLTLVPEKTKVGHGQFVALPAHVEPGGHSLFWLQDDPGLHGSDASITYKAANRRSYDLHFDCPTGLFPNVVSGGDKFSAKAGDQDYWSSKVPRTGHPLFVCYEFVSVPAAVGSPVGSPIDERDLVPTGAVSSLEEQ